MAKKVYKVLVTTTLRKEFEVEAESEEDAKQQVEDDLLDD